MTVCSRVDSTRPFLVKWQQKLGCPKPDEGFHDLLARARMFEGREKQFAASAQAQNEVKKGSGDGYRKVPQYKPLDKQNPEKPPERAVSRGTVSFRERRCHRCKQTGHIHKDCPIKTETPGRTPQVANTSAVGATEFPIRTEDLTESQLEKLLAERRLNWEKQELTSGSQTNLVNASGEQAEAVGTLLHVDVCIEGVPVRAMVDTGAQSTIISRTTLHAVNRHLKQQGRELPPLELPTVRLYGKDGEKGGKELLITAQVPLLLSLGDKSVSVPVFVQPDSDQACLLGINAIPVLGISVLQSDGKPVLSHIPSSSPSEPEVATVSLVESVTLPSQKGCVLKARVCSPRCRQHGSLPQRTLRRPKLPRRMHNMTKGALSHRRRREGMQHT